MFCSIHTNKITSASHFFKIANGGNWMNIKYANKIQARCALNRNGRVLDGKIMIGVRKCMDLVSTLICERLFIPVGSNSALLIIRVL